MKPSQLSNGVTSVVKQNTEDINRRLLARVTQTIFNIPETQFMVVFPDTFVRWYHKISRFLNSGNARSDEIKFMGQGQRLTMMVASPHITLTQYMQKNRFKKLYRLCSARVVVRFLVSRKQKAEQG
jgi:hypothetical protein